MFILSPDFRGSRFPIQWAPLATQEGRRMAIAEQSQGQESREQVEAFISSLVVTTTSLQACPPLAKGASLAPPLNTISFHFLTTIGVRLWGLNDKLLYDSGVISYSNHGSVTLEIQGWKGLAWAGVKMVSKRPQRRSGILCRCSWACLP